MFRRPDRSRLDRVLAAIEIPAIGLWLGALCGFAFVFAPAAFHIVTDLPQFAALTATNLRTLADLGAICGTVAIVAALLRSRDAADRTNDICRAVLIVIALGLVGYETFAIVPAMAAIPDLRSDAYHDLHRQSSVVYGAVVICTLAALVLAAIRGDS
jgi:hypothetical protein